MKKSEISRLSSHSRYLQELVLKFNVLFKLYLCTDNVISLYRGRFYARCAKNSSLYREYRYIEDRYIGVLSHTFYCNFCRDIAYLSLFRGYCYIEDRCIGTPLKTDLPSTRWFYYSIKLFLKDRNFVEFCTLHCFGTEHSAKLI